MTVKFYFKVNNPIRQIKMANIKLLKVLFHMFNIQMLSNGRVIHFSSNEKCRISNETFARKKSTQVISSDAKAFHDAGASSM